MGNVSPEAIASARRLITFERRIHGDKDVLGFALQALDALEAERETLAELRPLLRAACRRANDGLDVAHDVNHMAKVLARSATGAQVHSE